MTVQMEIVCIGNELLIGKTLNTNSSWIAKRSTSLGVSVKRITVVEDDVDQIAEVMKESLERRPQFIITTGGLGPTFDDKTLEGIAKALNRKLEVNDKALKMLEGKYRVRVKGKKPKTLELTPSRLKMAMMPRKTEPLPNPVGTAPGVMATVNETLLVALPGVPPEMEAIFDESVLPLIEKAAGGAGFFERSIYSDYVGEPTIAPFIDSVMRDNPFVYIKSHVYVKSRRGFERKRSRIEIHFSTTDKDAKTANKRLKKAEAQLSKLITREGGKIMRVARRNE